MDIENVERLCSLLEAELVRRERSRDLSMLAAGGAFEQWISFEARLVLEKNRNDLGIDDAFWTANEYKKVDLGVWEDWTTLHTAIEFKLIHNNKNWRAKVNSLWGDLFPAARSSKDRLGPCLRVSVVGVVGKVYQDDEAYPGQRPDLEDWEREMWSYALPSKGRYSELVRRVWSSRRFEIRDPSLDPSRHDHFVQFHLLAPNTAPAE